MKNRLIFFIISWQFLLFSLVFGCDKLSSDRFFGPGKGKPSLSSGNSVPGNQSNVSSVGSSTYTDTDSSSSTDTSTATTTETGDDDDSALSCGEGGKVVGDYCWYKGKENETCDKTCEEYGGCDVKGIRDFAGSGGSKENCLKVLDALELAKDTGDLANGTGASAGLGCYTTDGYLLRRWYQTSPATVCEARGEKVIRPCSCAKK